MQQAEACQLAEVHAHALCHAQAQLLTGHPICSVLGAMTCIALSPAIPDSGL